MGDYRLEELSATNIVAANSLTLRPGQEQFVTPTSYAIADAYINPLTTWSRVVLDDGRVVGFVRANFDFRPRAIIERLDLLRPIYRGTTNYGHFGKPELPWER